MSTTTPFVGIQMGAESFAHAEPAQLIDGLLGAVPLNTVMLFHGGRIRRGAGHGGNTGFRHPDPRLDAEGRGIADRLRQPLAERGMDLVLGIGEDSWGYQEHYPGYTTIAMVDAWGRIHRQSCVNNPRWRDFQVASVEDLVREHPWLRGVMFMHERSGPLSAAFCDAGYGDGRAAFCFCDHCCAKGRARGMDPERAKEGYRQLDRVVQAAMRGDPRPHDGWWIAIWRLFQRFPEILGWDQLWWDSIHDYRAALAGAARSVRPATAPERPIQVGYHFQHATSLNQWLWRAADDPARVTTYADWVKPSVYPGCSGQRMRNNLRRQHEVLLRDVPLPLAHAWTCGVMGHDPATLPDPSVEGQAAFGADWVRREVARITATCAPLPCIAGLGIGIPGGEQVETEADVTAWTEACFDGGAEGILLSRHHHEMRPALLAAAGAVIRRRLGKAKTGQHGLA